MTETSHEPVSVMRFTRRHLGRIVVGVILVAIVYRAMIVVMLKWRESAAVDQCLQNTKHIGMAFHNYLAAYKCLPELDAGERRPFGWRATLMGWFEASPVPSENEIRSMPAYIFNLSGSANPNNQSTTIYAITGDKTSFAPDNRCRFYDLPGTRILLISGRPSKEPWHTAANVSLEDLKGNAAVRDVVGETCPGITFILLSSGEAWAIDSSAPCSVVARCAEVLDEAVSDAAQQALLKYRLKVKKPE